VNVGGRHDGTLARLADLSCRTDFSKLSRELLVLDPMRDG
jgi:hypothetical protein